MKAAANMHSRVSRRAASLLGGLAVLTVWITWRAKNLEVESIISGQPVALLNQPAPDFRLEDLNGRTISLSDYRGKKVVVSFWASWCGPCRLELPVLRSFFDRTYTRDGNYEMLSINLDEDRAAAETAANQGRLPFPVLLDPGQKTANAFGVSGIPALFVVGRTGRVEYGGVGFDAGLEIILANRLGIDPKVLTQGGP